jgi:hypothetical protein
MAATLLWRDVSTPLLRDFVGRDGARGVARISQGRNQPDWRWSVFGIVPARPGLTYGYDRDPGEARRKVEAAWAVAKARGRPVRTAAAVHLCVDAWPLAEEGRL